MKYGDSIGGIYQLDRADGTKEWYLCEGKITKITENSRGTKVYSKQFYPQDKDDIEINTDMAKAEGCIIVKEVCLLTDELREKFVKWIKWANANPGKEKSVWSEFQKNDNG